MTWSMAGLGRTISSPDPVTIGSGCAEMKRNLTPCREALDSIASSTRVTDKWSWANSIRMVIVSKNGETVATRLWATAGRNTFNFSNTSLIDVQYVSGTGGDDIIVASNRTDDVEYRGGSGEDELTGGDRRDILYGGDNSDHIDGGGNADQLFGGEGADYITRDGLDSVVDGGRGCDQYRNAGSDDWWFDNNGDCPRVESLSCTVINENEAIIEWGVKGDGAFEVIINHVRHSTSFSRSGNRGFVTVKRARGYHDSTVEVFVKLGEYESPSQEVTVPKWEGAGTVQLQIYYFKAISSSIIDPCIPMLVPAVNEDQAWGFAQAQAENYDIVRITESEYNNLCASNIW